LALFATVNLSVKNNSHVILFSYDLTVLKFVSYHMASSTIAAC